MPAMSFSLLLIAAGAILRFGVTTAVDGVAIGTVGVILMIVGALGLLMSLLFLMSFSPFAWNRTAATHGDDHVDVVRNVPDADHAHVVRDRDTVVETPSAPRETVTTRRETTTTSRY